jgi:hypothetical protein
MKPKLLLGLALVLSGGLIVSRAAETNTIAATNLSAVKIVSPQLSVDLPNLGQAVFREQSSNLSLQVPIGFRKNGENLTVSNSNTLNLQVWLLKTDGTSIPQLDKPSMISFSNNFDRGSWTDYMFYHFQKVPLNELSGVVVSMNGKLHCHEIEKNRNQP